MESRLETDDFPHPINPTNTTFGNTEAIVSIAISLVTASFNAWQFKCLRKGSEKAVDLLAQQSRTNILVCL